MGRNSHIEWTDHTFNPWWGCTKVSDACKNCYAEAWSRRVGQQVWGPNAERRFFGERHWLEPLKWNADALAEMTRRRVFCASMADVFEGRQALNPWRSKLWELIEITPHLDRLLLTKRPELVPLSTQWGDEWPRNVWLGATVENQESADSRLAHLAQIPAAVRFISAEPLLGALDLRNWLGRVVDWVITGGESGPKARPSSPSWFRDLLEQCASARVPFHFKQWGEWVPRSELDTITRNGIARQVDDGTVMLRLGKKAAGRLLDGETWNGLPVGRAA